MTKLQYYLNIVLIFYFGLFISPGFSIDNTDNTRLHQVDLVSDENQETFAEEKADYTKLRFVSAIFRHGDRTPDLSETYASDPYKYDEFYPIGRGELTNVGKERSYQLGLLLRKLYDDFLGILYYQPHIYARSTFMARTKMSLQLVLAALFPPNNVQMWNDTLLWQPMDIKYGSVTEDIMLSYTFPAYVKVFEKVVNSKEVIEKTEKFRDIMERMSMYTGNNITNIYHLLMAHKAIQIKLSMNLELPKAAHILNADEQLFKAERLAYDLFTYNDELIRLTGGLLLRKIIEDMNEVINGTSDRKMNLFSGHDRNIFAMLSALHINDEIYRRASYTCSVILELHEWKEKYFVKVLYYWGIPTKVETLSIPGCESLCPYDKFLNLTSTTTATDADLIGPLHLKEEEAIYLYTFKQ